MSDEETTETHVDLASAALSHRDRPYQGNHIRPIQVQTLDALIRIEERLQALIAVSAAPHVVVVPQEKPTSPAGDADTPVQKQQPKRKNSREL